VRLLGLAHLSSKEAAKDGKDGKDATGKEGKDLEFSARRPDELSPRIDAPEAAAGVGAHFSSSDERPEVGEAAINQPLDPGEE
jgi:hypothetical protein